MNFKIIEEDKYEVFINNLYISDIKLDIEKNLEVFLKRMITNIKKIYNIELKGFCEVTIFNNKNIGSLIKIKKLESYNLYSKGIDLKIICFDNYLFYFRTKEYDVIKNYDNIFYYKDYYYLNISKISNIISLIEHGDIIPEIEIDHELQSL